jgi:hypothetical protein
MVKLVNIDNDANTILDEEIETTEKLLALELTEKKANTQQRMAWIALISMLIFVVILLTPLISVERLQALSDLFGLYFISISGIISAYFGFSSWQSNNTINHADNSRILYRSTKTGTYGSTRIPDIDDH